MIPIVKHQEKLQEEAPGVLSAERKSDEERVFRELIDPHISKPGALKLPPLLEKQRLEMLLPDELFMEAAAFDRVLVYQFRESVQETFVEGGMIVKTQKAMTRERNQIPRGLLCAAGLRALDNLRSNGIDLGHVVTFAEPTPYRIFVLDLGNGKYSFSLLVLRDGDIVSSRTLQQELKEGRVRVEAREITDPAGETVRQHYYVDESGVTWNPTMPECSVE